ncbi:probable glutamate carboxypeptidase VP8 isoform X1 [Elaeis guineensis]|uniref:glutamate carboxypeptidase II n=1 Tax=Elaeis guineensis var. tenera TaxID=51953 RepID=A0A6I9QF19_ELAGV|nr:probable glutamate carboxypeptidase VP8 isoform X1 [Elaeis guineensis]
MRSSHSPRPYNPHSFSSLRASPSLILLALLLFLLFYSLRRPTPPSRNALAHSPTAPAALFLSLSPSANSTIASHLRNLTLRPHLAGTPSAATAATYVLSRLRGAGLRTFTRDYTPLLSYPAAASLALLRPDGALLKPLSLAEPADPTAAAVPPYHAYAPSGATLAPAVYVNYGREEDYLALDRLGVRLRGCVAIARRGEGYRGGVVARAAERGAAAMLIFRDSGGGVERGMVRLGGVGDPLTPGWATTASAGGGRGERLGADDEEVRRRFPKIPSMPVSAAVAVEILRTLGGPRVPPKWRSALSQDETGVGPGPTLVNFTYKEDRKLATIQNVFGMIRGNEEPDRYVILGNHRDAWTFGAVDPNSGTAALLDVARRYGTLLQSGWRPRRTIILCSWDAEEFGMIGSTEWVEQNLGILSSKAVVYLNVDCAVQGPGFFAGATPQLDKLLVEVTKEIKDPDLEGKTVYHTWVAMNSGIIIERLARTDSDFSAFLHHAGVPVIDLYYGKEFSGYHTALDTYDWMEKHGDPMFHRHVAIAEIWGLLGLHLADDPVLPFDYLSYAARLQEHTNELSAFLNGGEFLQPVNASIRELTVAANEASEEGKRLQEQETMEHFAALKRRAFNDRLMLTERSFLEAEGLKRRGWFKHLLYSPPEDYESNVSFFPGIVDAIAQARKFAEGEGQLGIQHEIWRVARAIQRAASVLRGELT